MSGFVKYPATTVVYKSVDCPDVLRPAGYQPCANNRLAAVEKKRMKDRIGKIESLYDNS